jgi:carboxymethylenebutenolidase
MVYLRKRSSRIGLVGWSPGATFALNAAGQHPDLCEAVVFYYGSLETSPERWSLLQAPLLGIFGARDEKLPLDQIRTFRRFLDDQGKVHTFKVYRTVGHNFATPATGGSSGTLSPQEARDAWRRTQEFLTLHLAKKE